MGRAPTQDRGRAPVTTLARRLGVLALLVLVLIVVTVAMAVLSGRDAGPDPSGTPSPTLPSASPTDAPTTSPTTGPTASPTGPPCRADSPGTTLRLLTFNIHRGRHEGQDVLADVARVIERSGADVVALQEVNRHDRVRGDGLDQAAWLADRLGWESAFGANVVRPQPGPGDRSYGTAVLSRFPIRAARNVRLPNRPGLEQRGLLLATIDVAGRRVTVGNTHLQHRGPVVRLEQADAVAEQMASIHGPRLLAGDLNDEPGTPPFLALTRVLQDPWPVVGSGSGVTVPARNPDRRIDVTLADASFAPVASRLLETHVSDHLPVLTRFHLCR